MDEQTMRRGAATAIALHDKVKELIVRQAVDRMVLVEALKIMCRSDADFKDQIGACLRTLERQFFLTAEDRGHPLLFFVEARSYCKEVLGAPQPRARFELIQGGLAMLDDVGGEFVEEPERDQQ
ncbi:hypothetical protein [Methylocella silvestris]|uniref:Uncharacterized protein n=1 Tax=Methylocella silvestris TaxID=199596 RepID=A0A2J7TBU4_METSI|nr:hypothetical protein [Methylocella silvestris]PNG24236.1 hypothetical protein CR492_19810 [Methylocella silvestris]